jgi:hypothetical protein
VKAKALIFVVVMAASVGLSVPSARAAGEFSVFTTRLFAAGPCDPNVQLFVEIGVFAPFTTVGLFLDYPGTGGHEGVNGQAFVSDGIVRYGFPGRPQLIGGTTTLTAFLDEDNNLEPDPGSPVVTTTLTYCPPPLTAAECKKGGWQDFPNLAFKNQGDCVSYVATEGRNPPAG